MSAILENYKSQVSKGDLLYENVSFKGSSEPKRIGKIAATFLNANTYFEWVAFGCDSYKSDILGEVECAGVVSREYGVMILIVIDSNTNNGKNNIRGIAYYGAGSSIDDGEDSFTSFPEPLTLREALPFVIATLDGGKLLPYGYELVNEVGLEYLSKVYNTQGLENGLMKAIIDVLSYSDKDLGSKVLKQYTSYIGRNYNVVGNSDDKSLYPIFENVNSKKELLNLLESDTSLKPPKTDSSLYSQNSKNLLEHLKASGFINDTQTPSQLVESVIEAHNNIEDAKNLIEKLDNEITVSVGYNLKPTDKDSEEDKNIRSYDEKLSDLEKLVTLLASGTSTLLIASGLSGLGKSVHPSEKVSVSFG